MRQYIVTGMNGAHYYGFPQIAYGPWFQPIHHGSPFHSIWNQSHFHNTHHYFAPVWQRRL
ncbi:hypothetical protein [Bacillus sp. J33]|uniref:hypothetical protein n=1 Tax=Bacillus sp. J33 TaxID=935836 RepID=UPI00047DCD5E|nr:hypothetical protein [Bacillus sp. J33]